MTSFLHKRFSCRRSRRQRRGYTLVIFAMLLFALFALAALVIDLGLVRLTQRQMQTAADSAALEGLRGRDRMDVADPETTRRADASQLVSWIFDDDLNVAEGDAQPFGAGPNIDLVDGIVVSPGYFAARHIAIEEPPVYDPLLEPNLDNLEDGDMVADFQGSPQRSLDSFEVRLRRTDEAPIPGVKSSSGRIPLLFAQGSLLHPQLKSRGIALRASARSAVRLDSESVIRAKSIGKRPDNAADPERRMPGALPFVIYQEKWPLVETETYSIRDGLLQTSLGDAVGHMTSLASVGTSLGDSVPNSNPQVHAELDVVLNAAANRVVASSGIEPFGFVPLVTHIRGAAEWRIVGFAAIAFPDGEQSQGRIQILNEYIPAANVSAGIVRHSSSMSEIDDLDTAQLAELMTIHRNLSQSLVAAALIR